MLTMIMMMIIMVMMTMMMINAEDMFDFSDGTIIFSACKEGV